MSALEIARRGWAQGSILDPRTLRSILENPDISQHAIGVVITHSCDLRHHSFENEPIIEILVGEPRDGIDALCVNGRHPRTIDIELRASSTSVAYRFEWKNSFRTSRDVLASIDPSGEISVPFESLGQLMGWWSRRVSRTAFPDTFNERLRHRKRQLKSWMGKAHPVVAEMRIRFEPLGEVLLGDRHQVQVLLLAQGDHENIPVAEELGRLARELEELLQNCGFAPFGEYDLVTYDFLEIISVAQHRDTLAFDIGDHLSESSTTTR